MHLPIRYIADGRFEKRLSQGSIALSALWQIVNQSVETRQRSQRQWGAKFREGYIPSGLPQGVTESFGSRSEYTLHVQGIKML